MNEHHAVNIIRINTIGVHPNADKLEIIPVEGYQAVVAKGQFKIGDLAYYIPPDSIVPDRPEYAFLWGNATFETGVPVSKRRITAKKLRGEWSEGLLMPWPLYVCPDDVTRISDIANAKIGKITKKIRVGDDVSGFLGITHYNPEEPQPVVQPKRKRVIPRSFRGWKRFLREELDNFARQVKGSLYNEDADGNPGVPDYSVKALKKFPNELVPGEMVKITEKIHGSNARYVFMKNKFGFGGKMYVGTHYTWRSADSKCQWARVLKDQPWIEQWCREHPGYALYGEIVPTQNKYPYGTNGKTNFFVFDIRHIESGVYLDLFQATELFNARGIAKWYHDVAVPTLYIGPYSLETAKLFIDGPSVIDPNHIREGIVIETLDRDERVKLKIVSNVFLEAEKHDVQAAETNT
jgi:hypothetical protein